MKEDSVYLFLFLPFLLLPPLLSPLLPRSLELGQQRVELDLTFEFSSTEIGC